MIGIVKENDSQETRVAVLPESLTQLTELGIEVVFESGLGSPLGISDSAYVSAGGQVGSHSRLLESCAVIVRIGRPGNNEISQMKDGTIYIGFLDPFNQTELVQCLADSRVSAISMDMIPRSTRAQKMDALSSQANLAGYVAVITAAQQSNQIFPMMTTPAGTIAPARVFVIGAGVAGLQAIATAKRLGARVEAFDTRPEVAEQVRSLGAQFVSLDLGETESSEQGYAKALTEEQLRKQQEAMATVCRRSNIIITTAQLFGRKAPRILKADVIETLQMGTVVVDMAADSGGNVEGSVPDEIVSRDGVTIIGTTNLARYVPLHASQMYASNVVSLVSELWDGDQKRMTLDLENEVIRNSLVCHQGEIFNL